MYRDYYRNEGSKYNIYKTTIIPNSSWGNEDVSVSSEKVGLFEDFEEAVVCAKALRDYAAVRDVATYAQTISIYTIGEDGMISSSGLTFSTRHDEKSIKLIREHGPINTGTIV